MSASVLQPICCVCDSTPFPQSHPHPSPRAASGRFRKYCCTIHCLKEGGLLQLKGGCLPVVTVTGLGPPGSYDRFLRGCRAPQGKALDSKCFPSLLCQGHIPVTCRRWGDPKMSLDRNTCRPLDPVPRPLMFSGWRCVGWGKVGCTARTSMWPNDFWNNSSKCTFG